MNKTAAIILAVTVLVGVTAAALTAAAKNGLLVEEPSADEGLKRIAKALDRDIKNVERRVSQRYHDKNQEKYENIDWDEEKTRREDIAKNGCPFPAG
ncbi:MAG: hypothetical protein LBK53_04095 [Heliobacteriaceae bacterium]|jgi:hypothetical protein|nr:hypothetical protein [Heliobacteriaceae bacterium]